MCKNLFKKELLEANFIQIENSFKFPFRNLKFFAKRLFFEDLLTAINTFGQFKENIFLIETNKISLSLINSVKIASVND